MDDIEQLFEFASESVRRGNKRRDDEKKQLPENIIANAMLRKSAEMIPSCHKLPAHLFRIRHSSL